MNEENKPEPKIGGIEALVMVSLAALFDVADVLATFLDAFFGMGELVKFFINVVASVVLWLWVIMKDVGPTRVLAGSLLEFFPLANALPMRTVAMMATIWLDWHPKEAEIAETFAPKLKNPRRALGKTALAAKAAKTTQAV
ncbi:MAG: hypothetical protein Q7R63_01475 [bacterium]|nr:hypothetical protein [bacterium]